jgi:hypothetical protein
MLSTLAILCCAGATAALGMAADVGTGPTGAAAPRFAVALGPGARLGGSTSLTVDMSVAQDLAPVTELRLLLPNGMDLTTSGLGLAECRRPTEAFSEVMNPVVHGACPGNSRLGDGSARAGLRFDPEHTIPADANMELYSGDAADGKPGIVVVANTYHPARVQLTYQGYLYVPPPGYGLGIAIKIRPVPNPPFGAPIALSAFHLVVGGPTLTYNKVVGGRTISYRPRGLPLSSRCPSGGFAFRAILRYADGTRTASDARVPCPPAP